MSESAVFNAAVKLLPDQRRPFLDQACADDAKLRREVESLLVAHDASRGILQDPPAEPTIAALGATEGPGTQIGPYKLKEQIGEGGFGLVFVAEQQRPVRRKVAVKVIKPGMDSREIIARFEAERQALALMDHQHIARVLDAGTTGPESGCPGRPYFVMELVRGVPITEYCDANNLTPRERLELFIDVCHAVQHAHQKGVIHRDLKPSNILVAPHDGVPVVKVIDFGVAKAIGQQLTDKSIYTRFTQMIGTPLYMSPEQAEVNQLDVDTRSDIYALGVLLYELLTGTTPFDSQRFRTAALDEIRRIIREEDPPKPSTRLTSLGATLKGVSAHRGTEPARLTGLVRGELDWIVMKCLEKERTRRYDTAAGLHKDVQRYLDGQTVEACPPTYGYRLRKTYRRNRAAILTAGSFAVVLLVATVVSLAFGITSKRAEARARAQERAAIDSAQQAQQSEAVAQQALDQEKAARERLEQVQYAQSMQLAYQNWRDDNITASVKLLDSSRGNFRDWEWHYLERLCHPELITFTAESGTAFLYFSPDGEQIATTGLSPSVKLWNTKTGALVHDFLHEDLPKERSPRVCFNHDGSRIVTIQRGHIRVWDTKSGDSILSFEDSDIQGNLASFSWDDSRFAIANRDGTAAIFDAKTGEKVSSIAFDSREVEFSINSIAFSPDGSRIITGVRPFVPEKRVPKVKVWNAQTGKELLSLEGHEYGTFSPDGKRIVTASREGKVVVYSADTGAEILSLNEIGNEYSPSFSPDGKRMLTGTMGAITLWDAQTGEKLRTVKVSPNARNAEFSRDGTRILITFYQDMAQVFDADVRNEPLEVLGHANADAEFDVSADGRRIVTGSPDGVIKVWDSETAMESLTFTADTQFAEEVGEMRSVAISPDANHVVTIVTNAWVGPDEGKYTNRVALWNATTGDQVRQIDVQGMSVGSSFSPDARKLMVWGGNTVYDGWVQVWDTASWSKLTTLAGHTGLVFSGAFSPDGKRIVTTGNGLDQTARVWDADTGDELVVFRGHGADAVWEACFSPDGNRVVSSGTSDAIIWDAGTGEQILSLDWLTDQVLSVAYSPNGRRILTLSHSELKIWDAQTGHELLKLKDARFTRPARFSPDGTRVYVGGEDGLYVFDSRSLHPSSVKAP